MTRRMSVIAAAVLSLGTAWTLGAQTPSPPSQAGARLALVGGMLLDGYDAPPIHHAAPSESTAAAITDIRRVIHVPLRRPVAGASC